MMKNIRFLGAIMAFLVISSVSGAAPEVKVITANPGQPPEENDISTYCSLRCGIGWQTKASSHLKPQGPNRYDVRHLDDGLVNTAWIEGVKGYGIGETVTFTFTPENFKKAHLEKVNFDGFFVINGYCKDKKTWKENSRVKRIQIKHNDKPRYETMLHDSMNVQNIDFPETIWLHPGDTIKVTILAVYPGDKYQDTAISELMPLGAH
jgi:hypothetical protein